MCVCVGGVGGLNGQIDSELTNRNRQKHNQKEQEGAKETGSCGVLLPQNAIRKSCCHYLRAPGGSVPAAHGFRHL